MAQPFNHEGTPSTPALAGSPVPTKAPSPPGEPSASRLHNRMASELKAPEELLWEEERRKEMFAPTTLLTLQLPL